MSIGGRGALVAAGWLTDQVLGEPPANIHPVAWFGRAMRSLERLTYRPSRGAGVVHALVGVGGVVVVGRRLDQMIGKRAGLVMAVGVACAGRMLVSEADKVLNALEEGDLALARRRMASLVGRDTADLDKPEVVRAVIESLAENSVDAVIATLFWGLVGGTPGVLVHRAVNTLDAMVGHRDHRYQNFGWCAARLDDVANYVPARLSAVGLAVLNPTRGVDIYRTVSRDAPGHPSPNGGVIESAMAASLGVQLGGVNRYGDATEDRGVLGDGRAPTIADARHAINLTRRLGALIAACSAFMSILARSGRATR